MKYQTGELTLTEIELILKGLVSIQNRTDIKNQTELKNLIELFRNPKENLIPIED